MPGKVLDATPRQPSVTPFASAVAVALVAADGLMFDSVYHWTNNAAHSGRCAGFPSRQLPNLTDAAMQASCSRFRRSSIRVTYASYWRMHCR